MGPVTPVRRTDDFGIDLYSAMFDQRGRGAAVRDYFSVQVKSGLIASEFEAAEQIRWQRNSHELGEQVKSSKIPPHPSRANCQHRAFSRSSHHALEEPIK
jgi:hypothetical protein